MSNSSSSSSSAGVTLTGEERKAIDLYVSAAEATLVNSSGEGAINNVISDGIIRGDQSLLRFTIFDKLESTNGFEILVGDGLEFVVATNLVADDIEIVAYADNDQFNASDRDWET